MLVYQQRILSHLASHVTHEFINYKMNSNSELPERHSSIITEEYLLAKVKMKKDL